MEWRKCYLDVFLVPLGMLVCVGYHVWLWHNVKTRPLGTTTGRNGLARCLWVSTVMKDIEKKNILAIQTLRNTIMGSNIMATCSILLCCGLAAVLSSTYSVKKSLNDSIYGAHGDFMVAFKYVLILFILILSFIFHTLSVRFINQAGYIICCPLDDSGVITPEYVFDVQEKGIVLNTVGNRLFYAALPLLLWIFGPIPVFLCFVTLVPLLHSLDFVSTVR